MFCKRVDLKSDVKIIRETLRRVGVDIDEEKGTIEPNIYLVKRGDNWFLTHYKRLIMDYGEEAFLSKEDILLENSVAGLLKIWKMIDIPDYLIFNKCHNISIIKYEDVHKYELKYKLDLKYLKVKKDEE